MNKNKFRSRREKAGSYFQRAPPLKLTGSSFESSDTERLFTQNRKKKTTIAHRFIKDENYYDKHGQTTLMLAASQGRLDTVKLLLEEEADINLQDENGITVLMCAAQRGHVEIVRHLISILGCNLKLKAKDGRTALLVAGNKEVGILLYIALNFSDSLPKSSSKNDEYKVKSGTSIRKKSLH